MRNWVTVFSRISIIGFLLFLPPLVSAKESGDVAIDPQKRAAEIYAETCIVCHAEGVGGAPRPGIDSDWQARLAYGVEELYYNTIEGLGAAMPPRGLCDSCSDKELGATVDYMLSGLQEER